MIYKITNIRLRNGRTLNRGFIIESDKMLSRNKIATLIKERTNFTPVDFSAKMHRNLFESKEDVAAAIAAGNKRKEDIETENKARRGRNEDLRNEYKRKHEEEVSGAREKESKDFQTRLQNAKNRTPKSISKKENEIQKLNDIKNKVQARNTNISNINNQLNQIDSTITQTKANQDETFKVLSTKKEEYTTALNNYKTAKKNYDDELEKKNTLLSNLEKEKTELKAELGNYKDEGELDEKISTLKSEIKTKADKINARFERREKRFNDELNQKYDFDKVFDKKYGEEYNKRKEKEIDEKSGVNLAKVENYFEKKERDLTDIIKKFRKQVKMKKEGGVDKAVYTRLNDTLNKFEKSFKKIKKYVIAQYTPNEEKEGK